MIARALAALAVLLLAACAAPPPQPEPSPAVWAVTAPSGEMGWLFGTMHALPDGVEWRTPLLDGVARDAGVLIVEIADLGSGDAAALLEARAYSEGLPPLLGRVAPQDRAALAALLDTADREEEDFATTESWAAALMLASAVREGDPTNGVDRALIAEAHSVEGLETMAGQFALFDQMSNAAQAELLAATAREAGNGEALRNAWLAGDMAGLERLANASGLASPALREALQARRNRAWLAPISAAIGAGRRPLVAVGAAHMLGDAGLPALFAAQGWQVERLQ